MSNPSNLYAEKVFSEHPLALWPLDESVDYLALVSSAKKDLSNTSFWSYSNCSLNIDYFSNIPNKTDAVYKITSDGSASFEIQGESLIDTYVSEDLESIAIGFYSYPESLNVESIEFGYKYDGNGVPRYINSEEYSKTVDSIDHESWEFLSGTFPLPPRDQLEISPNNITRKIINKKLSSNVATLTTSIDHNISVGQTVYVANVDQIFDGNYEVLSVTDDTFSYALVDDDVLSVSSSGTVVYADLDNIDNTLQLVPGSPTKIFLSSHGFVDGDRVKIDSDFDLPNGINKYSFYFVVNADTDTFEIEDEIGSGAIEFQYPQFGKLYVYLVKTITPFIRYNLFYSQSSEVYLGGFTTGQIAEEFFEASPGISAMEISGINIDNEYFGIQSDTYGLQDLPAYYLVRENKLLAKNINMPMVYGSASLTSLLPERFGGPSFIFPGKGFLNEEGRYRTYTIEFWLRISPDTREPKRIFGPLNSNDGIYVDGPFITLKIGEGIQSHYVGEWYRPMLVNLIYFPNGASLIINGEKVFDISFVSEDLDLPSKTNLAGKDQDWLGFYSYADIQKFEIDCIAIYSYRIPSAVSKRRWVYGQAVDFPENLASAYFGQSFPIDYSLSEYSNNYIYPDIAKWDQGVSENISTKNNVLRAPEYSLPDIVFDNKTTDSWYRGLSRIYSNAIMLKPDGSWVDTNGYMFFERANFLNQKTSGFYGIFELPLGYNDTQTLFRLENKTTGNYLDASVVTAVNQISSIDDTEISSDNHKLLDNDIITFSGELPPELSSGKEYFVTYVNDNVFEVSDYKGGTPISISSITENSVSFVAQKIKYSLFFNSSLSLIYETPAITLGHSFVAGINFQDFANYFGGNVSTLIKNRSQLSLYVGGNKSLQNTFSGYIYKLGFCTKKNQESLSYLFGDNGLPFLRYQFDGGDDTTTGWVPEEIANAGYVYEDYVNDILSHIASYTLSVKNFFGERYLDIETSSAWQDYVPLSYFAKKVKDKDGREINSVDFIQINSNTTVPTRYDGDYYDTEYSDIKMYVSFQSVSGGPTASEDSFANTQQMSRSKIVLPGTSWITTKYEVVNGSLVYLPDGIDIEDTAIVIHAVMRSKGIIKNPIRIRSLSLSSKTLDSIVPNPIKTKFGVSLYPFTEYGVYYDYKKINPYITYTDSTPHLYLTKQSGIELTGTFGESHRGIAIPVNRERIADYTLGAIQFSAKFSRDDLSESSIQLLEIDSGNPDNIVKIWVEPILPAGQRFKFYATDRNGNVLKNVQFYINGNLSLNPAVTTNEWNMIGIGFIDAISFGTRSGKIEFVGPLMFNNVSYYALNSLQKASVPILGSNTYAGVDLSAIYKIYTGTNKEIFADNVELLPAEYRYGVRNRLSLQSATIKPV